MERPPVRVPADTTPHPPPPRRWTLPALIVLLAGTAVLYLWNLSASGWGNSFYAAAAQPGGQSWKAWLLLALRHRPRWCDGHAA